jgi:ribosomal protein S18 acetylase RimI-like enzyme
MQTPAVDVIQVAGDHPLVDQAAQIWAEATAARDGDHQVPSLDISRPVIQAVLDRSPEAFLLVARSANASVGFAAVEPVADSSQPAAEVSYLGVRPGAWGQGVGETLLREAARRLRQAGYVRAQLLVYDDNQRAVALYQRLGWQPRGRPTPHPRTGKAEQRYELPL